MNIPEQEKLFERFPSSEDVKKIIQSSSLNRSVKNTLLQCSNHCFNEKNSFEKNKLFEIESVIDYLHDELNTGHWSEVPIQTRQLFTYASFLKCIILVKSEKISENGLQKCLKCLDLGLLLGAPIDENQLLPTSANYLSKILNSFQINSAETILCEISNKRSIDNKYYEDFELIKAQKISIEKCPSLEKFNQDYFIPQVPVKLTACMNHWPALQKWTDVNYLLSIAANRTVPIEIGLHYVDKNWSQKLMTFRDFIRKHYLSEDGDIGYLAQYNLFDHVIELRQDICVPEYCCLSLDYENSSDPDINAWLGPKGTVSPLHFDPKNNILAQIYGSKQIVLFGPKDSPFLYPHEAKMLSNTSQIDPLNQDLEKFPKLSKATMYKCLLEPGEMLFIPEKWWHNVTALDKSFSVSFWWQ